MARHDKMQRVRGVVVVEDDLAVAEGSPLRNREQAADVLRRDARQETPFHSLSVACATPAEARSGTPRQVDMKFSSRPTAKKEPVMKNRAYAVVLAAVVALLGSLRRLGQGTRRPREREAGAPQLREADPHGVAQRHRPPLGTRASRVTEGEARERAPPPGGVRASRLSACVQ